MQPEEINDGVRLLIERMKTNPEDFDGSGPWGYTDVEELKEFLRPDEMAMLQAALIEAKRTNFTTHVLRKLTGSEQAEMMTAKPKTIIVPKDMKAEAKKILSEAFYKSMKKQFPVKLETI